MPQSELLDKMDEHDIRAWFLHADIEQALDTFRVCEGIIEARQHEQPKRKRRSDAGKTREATLPWEP